MSVFLQLGATRDGLDPYLHVAHNHGMEAILVETPDYILFRDELGRQKFDRTIAVDHPSDPNEVTHAIKQLTKPPTLILAGFERYIYSTYMVAKTLNVLPYQPEISFFPPNKVEQRAIISRKQAMIRQPEYAFVENDDVLDQAWLQLPKPLVIKPIDGAGGLGVFLASSLSDTKEAFQLLCATKNYDGEDFKGCILEEYIPGTEYSIQGIVHNGICHILALSKKFIVCEPLNNHSAISGFREMGHIAQRGELADVETKHFAQTCVETFGYQNGPFHIDMVRASSTYHFLEMGFRLSGNNVAQLVEDVSGYDWAEEVFAYHLGSVSSQPTGSVKSSCVGQCIATSPRHIEVAHQLKNQGYSIEIREFQWPSMQHIPPSLEADIARHTGILGRIIVFASSVEEVEFILQMCSFHGKSNVAALSR